MWSDNVRTIGRTMQIENTLWMALSGSGAEFCVKGTKLSITFEADNRWCDGTENQVRVAIYVDNVRTMDCMLDAPEKTVSVIECEEKEEHVVRIIKLSESAMSTCGISEIAVEGELCPTEAKEKFIEFVGDSITCGYGADDENRDHHFMTATEDVTKAYAYKTAAALKADYSMVSFSGYGIVSGYTATGVKSGNQLVPMYYEKLGFSYGTYREAYRPQDMEWDFTGRQPDLVVVNLGTNDSSYVLDHEDRREEYISGYVAFLKTIRKRNPQAKILCALGIMGTLLCPATEEAVERFRKETGDTGVTSMRFAEQLSEDGWTADWHPTERTHTKAAEKIVEEIKRLGFV